MRSLSEVSIIEEISDFCRRSGLAESTFGRLAINDGKLMNRLRTGGHVNSDTLAKLRTFMMTGAKAKHAPANGNAVQAAPLAATVAAAPTEDVEKNFRFFDNRQKYLLFVTTCSEKWVVADRVSRELALIHPRPPAVRLFDAGVGDGTVLARVMRAMHHRFPTMTFHIVGK